MAWCPECKSEYREGITVCADCGCPLVQNLSKEKSEPEITEEMALAMAQELQEMEEAGLEIPEEVQNFEFEEEEVKKKYQPVYVNNEEKAEENRSSAFTLLLVGGVGFAFIILFFFDVVKINVTVAGKYMISGVMGVLFLLFIIMGFVSMRNSKILKQKACKENNLTMEIKKWSSENFSKDMIDTSLNIMDLSEELQYFHRIEYIREAIKKKFVNLDEAYLERLIEEIYPTVFEDL